APRVHNNATAGHIRNYAAANYVRYLAATCHLCYIPATGHVHNHAPADVLCKHVAATDAWRRYPHVQRNICVASAQHGRFTGALASQHPRVGRDHGDERHADGRQCRRHDSDGWAGLTHVDGQHGQHDGCVRSREAKDPGAAGRHLQPTELSAAGQPRADGVWCAAAPAGGQSHCDGAEPGRRSDVCRAARDHPDHVWRRGHTIIRDIRGAQHGRIRHVPAGAHEPLNPARVKEPHLDRTGRQEPRAHPGHSAYIPVVDHAAGLRGDLVLHLPAVLEWQLARCWCQRDARPDGRPVAAARWPLSQLCQSVRGVVGVFGQLRRSAAAESRVLWYCVVCRNRHAASRSGADHVNYRDGVAQHDQWYCAPDLCLVSLLHARLWHLGWLDARFASAGSRNVYCADAGPDRLDHRCWPLPPRPEQVLVVHVPARFEPRIQRQHLCALAPVAVYDDLGLPGLHRLVLCLYERGHCAAGARNCRLCHGPVCKYPRILLQPSLGRRAHSWRRPAAGPRLAGPQDCPV
ncbi:hypothetical protein GGF43_006166, partial [Coemansia sp. RSA 2618]